MRRRLAISLPRTSRRPFPVAAEERSPYNNVPRDLLHTTYGAVGAGVVFRDDTDRLLMG
ncbi:hypothetical protein [Kolteria novifilia]|uniref:hypothetical protein n=1 Tax=Kolteria novifilia TaxID=2527975 RepID=UPI003AF3BC7E